jgi:hypothetical protein
MELVPTDDVNSFGLQRLDEGGPADLNDAMLKM